MSPYSIAYVRGVVWCGVVWCGVVWCGVVWCGVVWCVYNMTCYIGHIKKHPHIGGAV